MSKLDTLKQWLRDAYAMEQQSVQVLRRQSERLEHYPELGSRIEQHIGESERQGEVIQDCLNRLGDDNSAVKTGAAMLLGNLQALMGTISSDEVVKGVMFGYMHEHYEIAAYRVLIAAAEACERPEIGEICQRLLTEEEAMQQWLLNHIGEITQQYLGRLETHPETAKR